MRKQITKIQKELLESLGVGLVVLFGSELTGSRHPGSDVDIGVVFSNKEQKQKHPVHVYAKLHEVFRAMYSESELDIVYLQEAPLRLQFRAVNEGRVLFAVSDTFLADVREYIMLRYFDFAPVEQEFEKAMIQGV